ncbi:MAG: hypothetical protein GF308_06745, partial [Candidatus Heimdallarchaeota archaeon]|nr:hypothetical protein [Candidatus Heimdallarchaeota archaeon]
MPLSTTNEKEHSKLGERFKDLETRIDNIPLETAVEVSNQYNCSPELAKVIYLLNSDLNIDPQLILADLEWELNRLAQQGHPLPKVGSYYYNFAVKEARWIAFLRGTFPNTLKKATKKFYRLHKKMNERRTEDFEDLAMEIVMERQYVA